MKQRAITSRDFLNRLKLMQALSICIVFFALFLQVVAICTTEWYVLNVNEYIPASRGGLWNYCFVSNTPPPDEAGSFVCLKYEELPNFSVFVNNRLYDSRIMLLCSSGFCLLILIIETIGLFLLCCVNHSSSPTISRPLGYFPYLAIGLINVVGSVMDFVLKVSGFALFDSYIANLLAFNTVFMAYKSYSYWLMVISMILSILFWLFKVLSTKHVINLNKKLFNLQSSSLFMSSSSRRRQSKTKRQQLPKTTATGKKFIFCLYSTFHYF
jgi:hypothetical protein